MAFAQLLTALDTLFKSYDELKLSLARLSEQVLNVFNKSVDPRGQAAKINAFLEDTRNNLLFYLKSLTTMSAVITQEQGKASNQANIARNTMIALKKLTEEKGMAEALGAVIDELRKQEENQNGGESDGDENIIIERVLQGTSMLVQGIAWGLFRYIKEEMRKALDDSEFVTKAHALDDEVEKVKESITRLQSACRGNISALDNIMKELCHDGRDEEGFLQSFKSSAEALSRSCDEKLQSFKSE